MESVTVLNGTPREDEVMRNVINVLRDNLDPPKILLFGSRAKGTHYRQSDFDFAVDMKKQDDRGIWDLEEKIDAVSGLYGVDVIYLPEVDDEFRQIIFKTGKVVYERGN